MQKLNLYIIILCLILFSLPVVADDNYCLDQESWKECDNLIDKYPGDTDIQTLHALRLGLCAKVERGDLTVDQATDIFETARDTVLKKKSLRTEKGRGL